MAIASFGKKVFQVSANKLYTLVGLEWSGSLDTESQDKLKDKPSTYIKGIGLNTMSFEVQLRSDFKVDVRAEIESWEAIRDKQAPDLFILGARPVGKNKWLLKSVNVSGLEIDNNGRILKAALKLEFEEYVRAGKTQPKSSTIAAGTTPAAESLNMVPDSYLNPPNKAEEKRDNPSYLETMGQWGWRR